MIGSLRIILAVVAIITAIFVMRKIRKSQFVIEDTLFWLVFCLFLIISSIVPQVIYFFSGLLGFESPANFVFVSVIFLLMIKIFSMSLKISKIETKLTKLIQKYAIDQIENNKHS